MSKTGKWAIITGASSGIKEHSPLNLQAAAFNFFLDRSQRSSVECSSNAVFSRTWRGYGGRNRGSFKCVGDR